MVLEEFGEIMNLGTLGAILKFAIELESNVLDLYTAEEDITHETKITEFRKRIKKLKRLRRENTTEMILEPIVDFEISEYKINEEDSIVLSENKLARFYETAAMKVDFIAEVSNVLKQFHEQHRKKHE